MQKNLLIWNVRSDMDLCFGTLSILTILFFNFNSFMILPPTQSCPQKSQALDQVKDLYTQHANMINVIVVRYFNIFMFNVSLEVCCLRDCLFEMVRISNAYQHEPKLCILKYLTTTLKVLFNVFFFQILFTIIVCQMKVRFAITIMSFSLPQKMFRFFIRVRL